MASQQALDNMPVRAELWRRVIVDGHIDHHAWLRAHNGHEFVGSCSCGDNLLALRPEQHHGRTDYVARCRNPGCGLELVAPGGRIRKRKH